jgi:molybdopterin molybdotransferase
LSVLSFDEAQARLLAAARKVKGTDRVPLGEAMGRVLAEPILSTVDVPPLDNSGMDGYAVRCADVTGPGIVLRIAQRIPAGSVGQPLEAGTAARIFTGAPIPPGADAVVMQED